MSISNAQRQRVRGLQQRKWRRKYSTFVVEGIVNVQEVLDSPLEVQEVYATPEAKGALAEQLDALASSRAQNSAAQVFEVSPKELGRLSTQVNPHGALAVVAIPKYALADFLSIPKLLYLDGVSDPGNVGTLLRTADWFGVGGVLANEGTADWYNPKTVAASRGSLFRLPHLNASPAVLAEAAPKHPILVADLQGVESANLDWPTTGILAIGNESHGASEELLGVSTTRVCISRAPGSKAESLNAGVAGAILLARWATSR